MVYLWVYKHLGAYSQTLPAILKDDIVRQFNIILFLTLLNVSCNLDKDKFIIQTENQYETIEGENQIVSQTIRTLRLTDSLPIAILTKVWNYNSDIRLKYLTGLSKEDGIQDYLLDSIYYDKVGNDTLKKSFVYLDKNWQPAQTFYKKFRADKQVSYFMTERPFKKNHYFKKEIFYLYNNAGSILTETEVECHQIDECDSIFKKQYIYNSTDKLDSTISYIWKDGKWTEFRKKNGR
ncbi:MAG: hypothetical protein BroJett042_24060 [Bacteroidota bacterium]|nr:MAG: hypothetical protein BroJett042_24060 [Bacteroidota bacterium]